MAVAARCEADVSKVRPNQVWELTGEDHDHVLIVFILHEESAPGGDPAWRTIILYDTLWPSDVGGTMLWRDAEFTVDGEGAFVRIA